MKLQGVWVVCVGGGGHMRVSALSGQGLSFGSGSRCSFPEGPGDAV